MKNLHKILIVPMLILSFDSMHSMHESYDKEALAAEIEKISGFPEQQQHLLNQFPNNPNQVSGDGIAAVGGGLGTGQQGSSLTSSEINENLSNFKRLANQSALDAQRAKELEEKLNQKTTDDDYSESLTALFKESRPSQSPALQHKPSWKQERDEIRANIATNHRYYACSSGSSGSDPNIKKDPHWIAKRWGYNTAEEMNEDFLNKNVKPITRCAYRVFSSIINEQN